MGVIPAEKLPPKPQVLVVMDLCSDMGVPLVSGGLMDQPHIWLSQFRMAQAAVAEWEILNATAESNSA